MNYQEVLDMYFFNNYTQKEVKMRIYNPKEDIDIIQLEFAGEAIVDSNFLGTDVELVSAQIVKTTVDEFEF